jgi:O-antigen/teichoic acid export membrane protein
LRARELFSKTAMIEVFQSILRVGVLYLLVSFQYDKLIVLSVLNFGVTLFYNGAFFALARKFSEAQVGFGWDVPLVKEMLAFISMLVLTVLAQLLKVQGLVFLINLFYGLAVNAAYAIAVQVSNVVNNFIASFKQSVVPQLMASYGAGDLKSMHRLISFGTKISFLLLMMVSVPVIFNADFLLKIWLKNPPEYSSELVALVLLYINIATFSYFLYQGVHATGKIVKQQIWMSSLYFFNVILIFIVFKLGASFYSALYINMIVSVIQVAVNLYYAHSQYQYSCKYFVFSLLLPCLVCFAIISFASYWVMLVNMAPLMRFIFNLFIDVLLSVLLGVLLVLDEDERKRFLSLLKKKIWKKNV